MFKAGTLVRIDEEARSNNAGKLLVIMGSSHTSYRAIILDQFETRAAFYSHRWLDKHATVELSCSTPEDAAVFAQASEAKGYYCLAKSNSAKAPRRIHYAFEDAQTEALRLSMQTEHPVEVLAIMGTATPKVVRSVEVSYE